MFISLQDFTLMKTLCFKICLKNELFKDNGHKIPFKP